MKVIEMRNLHKRFNLTNRDFRHVLPFILNIKKAAFQRKEVDAVSGLTFDINEGDSIGLIGPNGGGKTTLLRLLAGIIQPTSGKIVLHKKVTPVLQLGSGFQNELTARENILLYGNFLGKKNSVMKKRIGKILEYAELRDYENVKLKYFSSGMYSRLAFSVMIDTNPEVLLLDEIFAVGDMYFEKKSRAYMKNFLKEGKTLVMASHDLKTMMTITNKCIYLVKGKVMAQGSTKEVIKKYLGDFKKNA
jgi:lipopolysaccharide transport system ATP-binding protein